LLASAACSLAASKEVEAEAEEARASAPDPLVEDVIVASRAIDDAAFRRERLIEGGEAAWRAN
jgi:hypothetical protein